jgi:hypothetical protein
VVSFAEKAGKTTFARDYLPAIAGLIHFVNVGLIAGGISPLRPELAAVTAGRLVLRELDRLVAAREGLRLREHVERPEIGRSVVHLQPSKCVCNTEFRLTAFSEASRAAPRCLDEVGSWLEHSNP